jgi:hypothetical protein
MEPVALQSRRIALENAPVHWASQGPRLFSSSTLACTGDPELRTSGIVSLVAADRWMDVQVVVTGGREQVRTRRFWRSSAAPPAPIAGFVQGLAPAREAVRGPSASDVIEASANLPSVGVEAWLAESGARVPVDRHVLVQLSDAHVSANVIDLVVALALSEEVRSASDFVRWSGCLRHLWRR